MLSRVLYNYYYFADNNKRRERTIMTSRSTKVIRLMRCHFRVFVQNTYLITRETKINNEIQDLVARLWWFLSRYIYIYVCIPIIAISQQQCCILMYIIYFAYINDDRIRWRVPYYIL